MGKRHAPVNISDVTNGKQLLIQNIKLAANIVKLSIVIVMRLIMYVID
jgi:hypothetical protein